MKLQCISDICAPPIISPRQPVQKYLHVRRDLANQRAQVATLEREHSRLTRLEQSLHSWATIVWYARRCGWVFPGETPIVVQGVGGSDCE